MTELGFIVALEIGAFVISLALARGGGARDVGAPVYRIVSAVERALRGQLARERSSLAGAAVLTVVSVLAVNVALGHGELGVLASGGVLVGALLCAIAAALSASTTAQAAGATHASARLGFNAALGVALRSGGAVGLGTQAASTLGALVLFAISYFASAGRAEGAPLATLAGPCALTAGYALGASVAAFVLGRSGATYVVGAEAGRAEFEATGDANDPRNPALVAGLVGNHVGAVATSAASHFALSAVATAAVLFAARSAGSTAEDGLHSAALALVARSFGLVACAAGILGARADEARDQGLSLVRGLASAVAIGLFGIVGASYWLAPASFPFFASAGSLGMVGGCLPALVAWSLTDRRTKPVREAVEMLRTGPSAALGSSIGQALERAVAPLAAVVILTVVAGALGAGAFGGRNTDQAIGVFTLSLLALSPYTVAVLTMAAVARSARSTTALAKLDTESAWRLQRLDDVGFVAASPARALLFTASSMTALPAIASFVTAGQPGVGLPGVLVAGSLAAITVLAAAGRWARGASRTADEVRMEVARQLPGAEAGAEGYTPSYRACEELTRQAASPGVLSGAGWVGIPLVLLGIGLGLVYRVGGSGLATAALSTFVVTAAVIALGAALAVDGARTVHGNARRLARLERETAGPAAPIPEDVLANVLGIAAGPGACSQALLLASFALVILSTLTNP